MSDLQRLLSLTHSDPHRFLGAHPTPRGLVVRVYRPDAGRVTLHLEGGETTPMNRLDPWGLFEVRLAERRDPVAYRLEIETRDGRVLRLRDPYAFLPTVGELDLYLAGEGKHERIYEKLGAHIRRYGDVTGISFAVWAPHARGVSVVGDFNSWDGRLHPMRSLGASGIWELFIPDLDPAFYYKYEIRANDGRRLLKADPFALATEVPPGTASRAFRSSYRFTDSSWMDARARRDPWREPMSIYELHLGSWRRGLSYRDLAGPLAEWVGDLGFTHVELLPPTEHPFAGSWGYQVSSYYAPTARFGSPDDFRYLIDSLHGRGIGVILDWVPAHFPKDDFALARFDGTALYEHLDPRQGEHPDWGTFIFNYGRNEVRNFLVASALFWLKEYHADGLRIDAVASMLYLDYSRKKGEWIPNRFGGNENLEAIEFLRLLNEVVHREVPGVLMVAEESTAWPGVSRPTHTGGLGFGFKWNMGWMNDTLAYFSRDPVHRKYHHHHLTFGLLYAWSENFILPLSHDEVVHEKGALLTKMPGDRWRKFANLRALYGYMWAHPGKKLLFMGSELAQEGEWDHDGELAWHLLDRPEHAAVRMLVRDLNRLYRGEPALWEADGDPSGFQWLDADGAEDNLAAFLRIAPESGRILVCAGNFSPVVRTGYRVGLPRAGRYREILNTDAACYGGGNVGNAGEIEAEERPWRGQPFSAAVTLPPLAAVWFTPSD